MTIQYCSDLHLEFAENRQWLEANPLIPKGDILLVGGDSYHLGEEFKDLAYWDLLSSQFKIVFVIPGNHEYYGGTDVQLALEWDYELAIRDNVFLLNNTSRMFGGVEFIFSTLWSRIETQAKAVRSMMYDFKLIRYNGKMISIEQYNSLFEKSWAYLQSKINTPTEHPKVVLTHHLPSSLCNIEKYHDSPINEGFVVELTDEIKASEVDYWLSGHSHGNKAPFKIGNTQMLTNQFGYMAFGETDTFDRAAVFELSP